MSQKNDFPMDTTIIAKLIQDGQQSIDDLATSIRFPSFSGCLNEMLGKRNKSVEVAAGLACINKATVYKAMNNRLKLSRNKVYQLAVVLEMSFEETQVLLKSANCAALSRQRKRDLYLIDGLVKHMPIDEIHQTLIDHGFTGLDIKA